MKEKLTIGKQKLELKVWAFSFIFILEKALKEVYLIH
jgi:hypothetical protein